MSKPRRRVVSLGMPAWAAARPRLLSCSAARRGPLTAVRYSTVPSAERGPPSHHTFAQHKPYSFLSPSDNPRPSALFAIDLLTSKNAQKKSDKRVCLQQGEPCGLVNLQCAGRLDADSTGLMVWSTDRRLIERIIGPSSRVEKECEPGPGLVELSSRVHLSRLLALGTRQTW